MGLDARVRYTKTAIKNSLISLLREKPVNRITVTEICELSEINRATFYRYYRDAYDLLGQIEQEFLDDLQVKVGAGASCGFKKTLTIIMTRIKEDGESFQLLFSENGDRHFPARVLALCYSSYADNLTTAGGESRPLSPPQQKWLFYFLAQGFSGILDQWISGGMEEPVSEVVEFAAKILQNTLKLA